MNGQGSNICIHNNKVCSLAPADRINVITSPRSAKAVEDAPCSSQDAVEHRLLVAVRKSSDQGEAIKEAISVILYALEYPQLYRRRYRDLLPEAGEKE